jgi:hypothetical protein
MFDVCTALLACVGMVLPSATHALAGTRPPHMPTSVRTHAPTHTSWECAEDIYRRLHQGQDVVVDRYAFSGIAYRSFLTACICSRIRKDPRKFVSYPYTATPALLSRPALAQPSPHPPCSPA